ncbi:hypothetical protein EIK77_000948 [Talaromyces pinophilus]|nr:hypothetical protein EIK77_000948 [Talaromyces pinophilus]
MADKSQSEAAETEGIVGVKADVKSLQQLSSSGKAAQENRDRIKNERAKRALDTAIEEHVRDRKSSGEESKH